MSARCSGRHREKTYAMIAPRHSRRIAMIVRHACLILLAASLCACGAKPAPTEPAQTAAASPATNTTEPALVEPTEDEMRALEAAAIDELNAKGGFVIQMSGAQSEPIKMKLDSFRKIECKPYTKAFRCEAEIGTSYPGTKLPSETLPSSHRYQKDDQGRWTRD